MYDTVTDWDDNSNLTIKDGEIAWVEDGSSYFAVLRSLPDFGCVLYEEVK